MLNGQLRSDEIASTPFNNRQLGEIATAVGHGLTGRRLRKYRRRLRQAEFWVQASRDRKRFLPRKDLARAIEALIKACERFDKYARIKADRNDSNRPVRNLNRNIEAASAAILLRVSGKDGQPDRKLAERLSRHDTNPEAALVAVEDLARRARRVRERLANVHRLTVRKGNSGDLALDEWVGDLMTIFIEATGRQLGVSTQGLLKEPGGPLIRFLLACGEKIGIHLSPSACRQRVLRVLKVHPHGKKSDSDRKAVLEHSDKCSGHDNSCQAETTADKPS